jgi:hypothetical protein
VPHYAGSRPGLFTALIKLCTHPTSSAYLDSVSQKLLQYFKGVPLVKLGYLGKSTTKSNSRSAGSVIKLNPAGARSVVQMAVKLGFLNDNFFWSWKGHAINILSKKAGTQVDSFLELDLAERIAYLKFYLEADGAMILTISEQLLQYPDGVSLRDLVQNPFVDDAFRAITKSYLELTSNLGFRTRLRHELLRLEGQSYKDTTRKHKLLPRLIPLEDFGLLARTITDEEEILIPTKINDRVPLRTLASELGNIKLMEFRFAADEYYTIIAKVLCSNARQLSLESHKDILAKEVVKAYTALRGTSVAVYALNTVINVVCVELLASHALVSSPQQVLEFLQQLQKDRPYDVHFHVDRQGRPAYLMLSENLLKEMGSHEHH